MKVLFFLAHPGFVRNFESPLRLLAGRGHRIALAFQWPCGELENRYVEALAEELPGVSLHLAPSRPDPWRVLARLGRGLRDLLRYCHPRYASAPLLRARAEEAVLPVAAAARAFRFAICFCGPERLSLLLARLEAAIPPCPGVTSFIRKLDPDVVLVTPLIDFGSEQVDYVRSAQSLGKRTGLCIASWDNLTNRGLIRVEPDLVLLWNEHQRREAVDLHGIPDSKIVATGAQRFDEWFERRPSMSRADFCARVGLDPTRPFVLYVCSSRFIAPREPEFVDRWVRHLRSSGDTCVAKAGILIRPHPQNAECWRGVDVSGHANVALWPRGGANPITEDAKADFFNSLHYCEAVVGINTSAFLEAAIAGVPTLTVADAEFAGTQEGTLHFRYLLRENGGILNVAPDLATHVAQLADALGDREACRATIRSFVHSFLRPNGPERSCSAIVAEEIERLSARGLAPAARRSRPLAWGLLFPVAVVLTGLVRVWRALAGRPRLRPKAGWETDWPREPLARKRPRRRLAGVAP